ncbi:hypothetical protein [Pantoea sp. UYEF8]
MQKQSYRHTGSHKNIARVEFCKAFNPKVAEKLRQMLEEHKAKEKGQ